MDWTDVDAKLTRSPFFAFGEDHALFEQLRRDDPVHWTEGGVRPFWSVTRHADVVAVLKDAATFSSDLGGLLPLSAAPLTPEQRHAGGYGSIPTHTDSPRHLAVRRPFNKHFAAPAISRMRETVQACVDDILDEIALLGHCDLVHDVAARLPARLVCEMMGVPAADHPMIQRHCAAFMGAQDPTYQIDGDAPETQRFHMAAIHDYMSALAIDRRSDPRADFTGVIGSMEIDGEPLDPRDMGWWAFAIVVAGLETTRDALSVGMRELMRSPVQAQRLRADPTLAHAAAEEFVRWSNPSKHKFRVVTRDVEFGGKQMAQGDWVMCWLVSANRDERVFADPYRFDIGRKPNPHLGYGVGEHSCLGRHLARLEIELMQTALLDRLPDITVDGDEHWLMCNNHTALVSLPVTFTAPAAVLRERAGARAIR